MGTDRIMRQNGYFSSRPDLRSADSGGEGLGSGAPAEGLLAEHGANGQTDLYSQPETDVMWMCRVL